MATKGTGLAAVQSSKDALAKLISGKQQDVFTPTDLQLGAIPPNISFNYNITIYDKELGMNVPIPNDNGKPPVAVPITIAATTVDQMVTEINNNPDLSKHIEARNVNGNLVIQTKEDNYDVEFNSDLMGATSGIVEVNKSYSGRKGAGAEFLEIRTTVDQTSSQGSIQLRLDTLNISDSPFGEFSVDNTGLITMKQDGAEFAIGQVAIARFNNNRGLSPEGNNLFGKTSDSGDPIYNINNNKTAEVRGKALELSNSDLSESLVNLMIFQRAFEANAKSITTADELLNTLINLKR